MNKRRGYKTLITALKEVSKLGTEYAGFVQLIVPDEPLGTFENMDRFEHAYKKAVFELLWYYIYEGSTPFLILVFPRKFMVYYRDGDTMSEFFLSISEGVIGSTHKWIVTVPYKTTDEWELTNES